MIYKSGTGFMELNVVMYVKHGSGKVKILVPSYCQIMFLVMSKMMNINPVNRCFNYVCQF